MSVRMPQRRIDKYAINLGEKYFSQTSVRVLMHRSDKGETNNALKGYEGWSRSYTRAPSTVVSRSFSTHIYTLRGCLRKGVSYEAYSGHDAIAWHPHRR